MQFKETVTGWVQGILEFVRNNSRLLIVAAVSAVVGIGIAGAYGSVIDYTSHLDFCAHTCHEMEATVYAEYTHSKHFKNEFGVVVACPQCHVPHNDWPATFRAKFFASFELWNHFVDKEYELDKFEPRRIMLAKKVWAEFERTNAATCKSCHAYQNMVLTDQRPSIRAQHTDAMKKNENCLDCHKWIVHKQLIKPAAPTSFGL